MQKKLRIQFSKFTFANWVNLISLIIIVFYFLSFSYAALNGPARAPFAGDYLAFWSAGKVADENGYSAIYDLENLKRVQLLELNKLGLIERIETSTLSQLPVALFSVFVLPFHILSKIDFVPSYWVWTFVNLIVLVAYLIFYATAIGDDGFDKSVLIKTLLLMVISYPVWSTLVEGQVEVFLVICVGEFIRQAVRKKPILSGLWLGGLLLKPQLLILIIPALLFLRNWKVFSGFTISSILLLMTSFVLSGFAGMVAMLKLWTGFSAGMTTNAPEMMINWRMVGLNINSLFGISFGWVIAGLGMIITIVIVYLLMRRKQIFGSLGWIITMAAVISATLAVTWHSHYHMAVVMLPFLIFAYLFKVISEKTIFAWVIIPPILSLLSHIFAIIFFIVTKNKIPNIGFLMGMCGFLLNILVIYSFWRFFYSKQESTNASSTDIVGSKGFPN